MLRMVHGSACPIRGRPAWISRHGGRWLLLIRRRSLLLLLAGNREVGRMRARRRPSLACFAGAAPRCGALIAFVNLFTSTARRATRRVTFALLVSDREPSGNITWGLHVRGCLSGDGLLRGVGRWRGRDLLCRRSLLVRRRCGAPNGRADGHVRRQAALRGVEAGLYEVLAFGLGDEGLKLGGSEGVHEAGLGDDEQEDLGACECRELVSLFHDACCK